MREWHVWYVMVWWFWRIDIIKIPPKCFSPHFFVTNTVHINTSNTNTSGLASHFGRSLVIMSDDSCQKGCGRMSHILVPIPNSSFWDFVKMCLEITSFSFFPPQKFYALNFTITSSVHMLLKSSQVKYFLIKEGR